MTMNRNDLGLAGALRDLSRRYFAPQADMAAAPAPVPNAYLGVWRRSLLETADLRDTHSHVFWLQTPRWHADLRLPTGRPDFSGVRSLAECSEIQLAWLARQQGFCGVTQIDSTHCTWHRQMDFQPANGSRDIGRMVFDGECLTETGIETDYLETWERLPPSRGGTAALELVMEAGEPPICPTWLLVAGACFMYVQGRPYPLSDAPDLPHLIARM